MFNIGYKMAMNLTNNFWQCFIFHDVDLLLEDDRNLYTCPDNNNARHMSVGKKKYSGKINKNYVKSLWLFDQKHRLNCSVKQLGQTPFETFD